MKVRIAEAIKDVDGLYKNGTIFTEYCDNAGMFYPDTIGEQEIVGVGINIEEITEQHGGFDKFFRWLDPIDAEHTIWYKKRLPEWKQLLDEDKQLMVDTKNHMEKLMILIGNN